MEAISNKFDQWFCGETHLPASSYQHLSDQIPKQLIRFRLAVLLSVICELIGSFLITYGLFSDSYNLYLIVGLILKSGFGLLSSYFQNILGLKQSLQIEEFLSTLKTHSSETHALLSEKACSENEIRALPNLPSEIYQIELQNFQRIRFLNLLTPLSCALAFAINGEIALSLLIACLGLLSFPIGEYFFKQHAFRHESEFRLAKSARLMSYLSRIYNDHIRLTLKINLLSQLPFLLVALRVLLQGKGELLASFYGMTQGLIGLSESLSFQRSRVFSIRSALTAKRLFEVINSPSLILTKYRWNLHASDSPNSLFTKHVSGVDIVNFQVRNLEKPINHFIQNGHIAILRAKSGKGKSTFLVGLLHYVEHSGDIYFINKEKVINIHTLTRDQIAQKICYLKEENLDQSARLVDLFRKPISIQLHSFYCTLEETYGQILTQLAMDANDNLIQHELELMEQNKQTVFPSSMYHDLKSLRQNRIKIMAEILVAAGGNLASQIVHPERVFGTLSSGEKKRLLTIYALKYAEFNPDCQLIVLDEPLSNLDPDSIKDQLLVISQMQQLENSPAILLISHLMIEEMQSQLANVSIIDLH